MSTILHLLPQPPSLRLYQNMVSCGLLLRTICRLMYGPIVLCFSPLFVLYYNEIYLEIRRQKNEHFTSYLFTRTVS